MLVALVPESQAERFFEQPNAPDTLNRRLSRGVDNFIKKMDLPGRGLLPRAEHAKGVHFLAGSPRETMKLKDVDVEPFDKAAGRPEDCA